MSTARARIGIVEHDESTGIVESLNEGIRVAEGDLIARQNADDISDPQRLAKQYSRFCRDENLAVLGTSYFVIDQNGKITDTKHLKEELAFTDFSKGNQLCHGSAMFKKRSGRERRLVQPLVHSM